MNPMNPETLYLYTVFAIAAHFSVFNSRESDFGSTTLLHINAQCTFLLSNINREHNFDFSSLSADTIND